MRITCIGTIDARVHAYIEKSYESVHYSEAFTTEVLILAKTEADHIFIVISKAAIESLEDLAVWQSKDTIQVLSDMIREWTSTSKTVFLTSIIKSESSIDLLEHSKDYFLAYCVAAEFTNNRRVVFIPESYDQTELEAHDYRKMLVYNSYARTQHIKHIILAFQRLAYRNCDPVKVIIVDADNTLWGGLPRKRVSLNWY